MKNKKKIYTGLAILGLITTIGVGSAYAREAIIRNNSIDGADAKKFALIDAGVSEKDVTYTEIDFEKENGNYIYDIEFVANGIKYYYHVNASDGRILAKGKNSKNMIIDDDDEVLLASVTPEASKTATSDIRTSENTTTSQTNKKQEGSASSSMPNVSTNKNSTTTTPKTKSETKTETSKSQPAHASTVTPSTYISLDKAKEIALKHAGVSLPSAIFEAAKLEEDDGKTKYDIEFFTSEKEYDYEIDAFTGKIIEYSIKKQDKLPSNIVNKKQLQNTNTNQIIYDNDDLDDVFDDDRFDDDDNDFDDDHDFDDDDDNDD